MKPASDGDTEAFEETAHEFDLPGGCILCGGDLRVKVTSDGAASVCTSCRWISHPHMRRSGTHVHVIHPAGGIA